MREELNLFRALSDETRLRIMVLLTEKELCVCQLEWALGLTQAKVSRHLTVLKNAGLVQDRREGLWIFYSLAKPKSELEKIIHKYLKEWVAKKYELFKKDIDNMKKCMVKPLEKLTTIRR
ncbi:MAG: metalloregulator ArsR/SmtB family transcription factor [Candidatus Omnitrophota bacterium]